MSTIIYSICSICADKLEGHCVLCCKFGLLKLRLQKLLDAVLGFYEPSDLAINVVSVKAVMVSNVRS